jgi:hypothetical protein
MNILQSTTFTWWQLGMLKWAVLCIGIAIGANFAMVFIPYVVPLIVIGLTLGLYLGLVWMKNK